MELEGFEFFCLGRLKKNIKINAEGQDGILSGTVTVFHGLEVRVYRSVDKQKYLLQGKRFSIIVDKDGFDKYVK